MFICICHGITDSTINQSIDNGASSMRDLAVELDIATQCGKCKQATKALLDAKLDAQSLALGTNIMAA